MMDKRLSFVPFSGDILFTIVTYPYVIKDTGDDS